MLVVLSVESSEDISILHNLVNNIGDNDMLAPGKIPTLTYKAITNTVER